MNNIDQIIAEIRENGAFRLPGTQLLALIEAYDEAVATMKRVAQERQDALREFVEAAQERDRLKEGRDACAKTMAKMEQAKITIEMERDRLKERCNEFVFVLNNRDMERNELRAELEKSLDKCQQHMDERDALRVELENIANANVEAVSPMLANDELSDSEAVRSGDWLGSGAGQTLARPTAAGWWWWRNKGAWMMVEVHACRSGLYCPFLDMADAKANGHLGYKEWLGEWAGPLTPPPLPSDQAQRRRE